MRPYLAVIADSFHSALASRILWIAFLAIWLFLAALAPIGYHEDYTTTFRWFDLDNGTQLKAMLARGLVDPKEADTALGRIARTFPAEIKRQLRQVAEGDDVRIDKSALADSLNEAMDDESWYDPDAWRSTVRLRELRELDELPEDQISTSQRRRRARLRIEAALPGVFAAQAARSITLSYAGFDFPAVFSIGKDQFVALVNQIVVPVLMNWLLGFALIFLGILVTASIVPEMLQPGSLHLLLSKPISRTLLLLSKFLGGCAFVFLCVCQLVIGLWLIAGFRLDIWNARILWCIPVAVFLFAVFFSVSMFAGLRWRSAILSIGITCMFGAFVMVIGFIGGYFDTLVRGPDRVSQLAFSDDQVVISTQGGGLKRYDPATNRWRELLETEGHRRDLIVPPIQIADGAIASARIRNGRFNLYGSGSLDLLVLDVANDWEPKPSLRLPIGTRRLFKIDDRLVALNNTGLMATPIKAARDAIDFASDSEDSDSEDSDSEDKESQDSDSSVDASTDADRASAGEEQPAGDAASSSIGVTAWISDLLRMQGGPTEDFQPILPKQVTLTEPVRVTTVPGRSSLVIYTRGRLAHISFGQAAAGDGDLDSATVVRSSFADGGRVVADVMLPGDDSRQAVLAASDQVVLVAREDQPVRWIELSGLETVAEAEPPESQQVLSMTALGSTGQFAMLTIDGRCHVGWCDGDTLKYQTLPWSDVAAIDFQEQTGQLVIAHHIDQVDFVTVDSGNSGGTVATKVVRTIRPTLTSWRSVDRYLITPLRMLTPQTGELSDTVSALVSGKSSFVLGQADADQQEVIRLKIARPVLSCSVFLVVMLTLSCMYFSSRDF
ncbi:ABC transporter permease [Roseiconus nitratireducens]|uniref:ABC transporter permease n=1 Tax=Roseiconus nitratireducens TaxID=2605748 RepID=A0A5M6CZ54_9BACT|nr:ABC transporter permease [Roseiconus nitratireducens]KAA5540517.1 ABC transporter permease [Roseiconus nitratireducens]